MTTDFRALCAELAQEVEQLWSIVRDDNNEPHPLANRARALLNQPEPQPSVAIAEMVKRLHEINNPTPQPVAVSERLPGLEDCDAEGRCWWHRYTPTKEWHLQRLRIGQYNHWLPANALPTPEANAH